MSIHTSASALRVRLREKMKRLNSLLDDFTTLFSGFYASLFLYSEVGREEGKKMCSKLALADDTAYIYIHLHCCGLVVPGSDDKTVRLSTRKNSLTQSNT
jgi:hypothetical protein